MNNAKRPYSTHLKEPVRFLGNGLDVYLDGKSQTELKRVIADADQALVIGNAAKQLLVLNSPSFSDLFEEWLKLIGYEELGDVALKNIKRYGGRNVEVEKLDVQE